MATTAAVVVAGLATVAAPAAGQARATAPQEVPALASPPLDTPPAEAPRFTDDVRNIPPHPSRLATAAPAPRPSAFDPARSRVLEDQTTAVATVYANPDGTRTAALSPTPVRFRLSSGRWADIDLSVVVAPDGTLGPRSSPSTARLSPRGEATVAVVDTSAGPIGLRHARRRPRPRGGGGAGGHLQGGPWRS